MTKQQTTVLDALMSAEVVKPKTVNLDRLGEVTVNPLDVVQYARALEDAKGNQTNFMVAACVHGVEGNPFGKAELLAKYDATTPMQCARKALQPGEVMELGIAIIELSGFSADSIEVTQ